MNTNMAESDPASDSWWGSWIQTAKEKSTAALDFVKRDLAEFTSTVQNDTSKAVSSTSSNLRDSMKAENTAAATSRVKQGFSSFVESLSKALAVEPDNKAPSHITTPSGAHSGFLDRSQARLHAIQVDTGTYLNLSEADQEFFPDWLRTFNMDEYKGQISELLVSKAEVRSLYTRLVPGMVSHADFWQRYFFKVNRLEQDEARKRALMQRADASESEEDTLDWDDDDDFSEENSANIHKEQRNTSPAHRDSRLTESPDRVSDPDNSTKNTNLDSAELNTNDDKLDSKKIKELNSAKDVDKRNINEMEMLQPDHEKSVTEPVAISKESIVTTNPSDTTSQILTTVQSDPVKRKQGQENIDTVKTIKEPENIVTIQKDNIEGSISESQKNVNTDVEHTGLVKTESDLANVVQSQDSEAMKNVNESSLDFHDNTQTRAEIQKPQSLNVVPGEDKSGSKELKFHERGDLVVVSDATRDSPSISDSSSNNKESSSVDEDWERDFDIEVTEEDLKAAEEAVKKLSTISPEQYKTSEDDWENWE